MPIRWDTAGLGGNVRISLSTQGGKPGSFITIVESTENEGVYDWLVQGESSSYNSVLRIEPLADPAKASTQGLFTIICDSSGNGNADIGLETWQQRSSGTTNDLEKVIFAQDQFVAVGYGGTVLSSPDGVTWTLRSQGSHVIKDIAFGNGVYVAVGGSGTGGPGTIGKIWTSVDLENWIDQNLVDISWRYSIAYGGGIFVAGGDFSDIQISPDGYMWTQTNWPLAWYLNSITYGDNRFIGVTAGRGYIGSSVNGCDWIEVAQYDAWWMSVTYGSGLFVSAGGRLAWDGPNIAVSHDGVTWAEKSIDMNVMEVTHGNGFFVGVGADGKISSSENGTVWTPRNSGVSQNLRGVAYGKGTFVAVGENGTIIQTGCIAFEPGDVNRDCEVNLTDAITMLQVVSSMSPSVAIYEEGDVNTDGKLSIEDVIYVLQIVSGLR